MRRLFLNLGLVAIAAGALGQRMAPAFASDYRLIPLGVVPGHPGGLGAIEFDPNDPNLLFLGANSIEPNGELYKIRVLRDGQGRIVGYDGRAALRSRAPQIDGGLCFSPTGVLFYACYPTNELGQITPNSVGPLKTARLGAVGINSSIGAIRFVPRGFPGAGSLKLASYTSGQWYDVAIRQDAAGTYDVVGSSSIEGSIVEGGAGSAAYVPLPFPQFAKPSVLVTEFDYRSVSAFELSDDGCPLPQTRREFVTGLIGVQGATLDRGTGDLLLTSMLTNEITIVRAESVPARITGGVVLQDYVGSLANLPITVSIRNRTTGAAIQTLSTRLNRYGAFALDTNLRGRYRVTVKLSHWLRDARDDVSIGPGTTLGVDFTLRNGDANGDNVVNVADFVVLRNAFGSRRGSAGWNEMADLDGNGSVGTSDFLVLRKYYGMGGA
ncbi:MAG: hypothetical protein KIS66_02875 [Fimbriimonadaceae bacterium]|nr:hypothetical protein [Fimbriimonadaceae bacterium]